MCSSAVAVTAAFVPFQMTLCLLFFNCLNPMCTVMRTEIFKDLEVSKSWQRLIISKDLILGSDSFSPGVSMS